jgi:hypothetical protein
MSRKRPPLTPEQWEEINRDAGKGLSTRFSDNGFWLPHDVDEEAIEALVLLDDSDGKNKQPLIKMLRRRGRMYPADRDVYFYVADVLDRYQLKRKPGKRQTPTYDLTDVERRLEMAKSDIANGKSLQQAAADWGLNPDALENFLPSSQAEKGEECVMTRLTRIQLPSHRRRLSVN